jgi:hypothetical protein
LAEVFLLTDDPKFPPGWADTITALRYHAMAMAQKLRLAAKLRVDLPGADLGRAALMIDRLRLTLEATLPDDWFARREEPAKPEDRE